MDWKVDKEDFNTLTLKHLDNPLKFAVKAPENTCDLDYFPPTGPFIACLYVRRLQDFLSNLSFFAYSMGLKY